MFIAVVAQLVEHLIGNEEVSSSNLPNSLSVLFYKKQGGDPSLI